MKLSRDNTKALEVKCPTCSATVQWTSQSLYRPFCSQRCQQNDFVDWASENHRIAGDTEYGDTLSEDLAAANSPNDPQRQ